MLSIALVGGAGFFIVAGDAFAGTETIAKPMFNGKRLDWCANWTDDCGKPAADAFCKTQGYGEATVFKRDPHIGGVSPTRVISTGAVCDLAHCDGFLEITCLKLPIVPPEETVEAKAPAGDVPEVEAVATAPVTDPSADAAEAFKSATTSPDKALADDEPVVETAAKPVAEEDAAEATETDATAKASDDDGVEPVVASDTVKEADEPPAATAAIAEKAIEASAKPVRLASAGPTPPQAAMTAVAQPPTPSPKPVRVASAVRPLPAATKAFPLPIFGGKRLDWCRGWKDTCGQTTADHFCQMNGFVRAVAFAPDPHIGRRQPTRQIATGMVCDQEMCDGFKIITCAK
jgi:hypothetical protein